MKPTIALLTDFGESDGYVGAMKGVIRTIAAQTAVLDISHRVPPQNVLAARYILSGVRKYFPPGTIFVCVVDPGVGTDRKGLCVSAPDQKYYVGPDNGLFSEILQDTKTGSEVRILENSTYFLREISGTFHGRDVFAPVAAHLARALDDGRKQEFLSELGSRCENPVILEDDRPQIRSDGIEARIVYTDHFGNLITNLTYHEARKALPGSPERWQLQMGRIKLRGLSHTYENVNPEEALFYIGSTGYIEIAIQRGSAAREWGVSTGAKMLLSGEISEE